MARTVLHLGPGSLLAKADIKEAFRNIPVHPVDRLLLAMQWIVSYPDGKIGGGKPSGDNSASCSTFGRRDQNDVASKLHTMHSEKRTMDTQGS